MVQLTAEGHCTRRLALPAGAVQAALRRDRHAEHAVIVLGDDGLVRLRTFSPSCTVAVDALDPLEAIDAEVQVAAADGGLCGRAAEALWSRVRGVRERRRLIPKPPQPGLQISASSSSTSSGAGLRAGGLQLPSLALQQASDSCFNG